MERRSFLKFASLFFIGLSAGVAVGDAMYRPKVERYSRIYEQAFDTIYSLSQRQKLQRRIIELALLVGEESPSKDKLDFLLKDVRALVKVVGDARLSEAWNLAEDLILSGDFERGEEALLKMLLENQREIEDRLTSFEEELLER